MSQFIGLGNFTAGSILGFLGGFSSVSCIKGLEFWKSYTSRWEKQMKLQALPPLETGEKGSLIDMLVCRLFPHSENYSLHIFSLWNWVCIFFPLQKYSSQCNLMGCCPVTPAWQKLQLNSSSKGVSSSLLRPFTSVNGINSRPAVTVLMRPIAIRFFLKLSMVLGNYHFICVDFTMISILTISTS